MHAAAATSHDSPVSEVFDPQGIIGRLGGNRSLCVEIAEMFLEDCGPLFAAVCRAITADDAAALTYAAHTLRGAIGSFSLGAAYESAKSLECIGRSGDLAGAGQQADELRQQVDRLAAALRQFVLESSHPTKECHQQ